MSKPKLNNEQIIALELFINKYGRNWRADLLSKWSNGSDANEQNGSLLRQIRNQFGPSYLLNTDKRILNKI